MDQPHLPSFGNFSLPWFYWASAHHPPFSLILPLEYPVSFVQIKVEFCSHWTLPTAVGYYWLKSVLTTLTSTWLIFDIEQAALEPRLPFLILSSSMNPRILSFGKPRVIQNTTVMLMSSDSGCWDILLHFLSFSFLENESLALWLIVSLLAAKREGITGSF